MRLQVLSDLHLETEVFEPRPAPDAELLVLAGDIDSTWRELERFGEWPVPVIFVAGNHEFDQRELTTALPALRERCESLGVTLLERQSCIRLDAQGRRIRFVATTRWSDFELLGEAQRLLANDAANAFLYQPQWVSVAHKNLKGLWKDMPIFVNDLSALSWA